MTRTLTPTEVAIVAPLMERRALILAQANEIARGIMATAYAMHGSVDPTIEIRQTEDGGFVLVTPNAPPEGETP